MQLEEESNMVAKQREQVQGLKQEVTLHKTNCQELKERHIHDEASRVSLIMSTGNVELLLYV